LARRQGVGLPELFRLAGVGAHLPADVLVTTELELKYAGYFERERLQAERLKKLGDFVLASDLNYLAMQSLSVEARQNLSAARPPTLAQASRLSGISPSALQNLVIEVERRRRVVATSE